MRSLPELLEARSYECRLTPDRALESLDEAEAFLRGRGMMTGTPDCSLPSLHVAVHEEPYAPGKGGFAEYPKTKWRWGGTLAERPGIHYVKLHRGKGLFVTEETARFADPLCRGELERAEAVGADRASRRGRAARPPGAGMALRAMIRDLRDSEVGALVDLRRAIEVDAGVLTERGLLHRIRGEPPAARRRYWVSVEEGELVGWTSAGFRWQTPVEGVGELRGGVRPDRRGRGLGAALYRRAERHLLGQGARKLDASAWEEAGKRFLRARGFRKTWEERLSALDPRSADLLELSQLEAEKRAEGFRLVTLGQLRNRPRDLYVLFMAAAADAPADEPRTNVAYAEWKRLILEHPDLDDDGGFVVVAGERPVSFAWLHVDRERSRAENEMTGTLREFRNRGLARLAKLAAVRWAAEQGLVSIFTGNDLTNAAMLAINERLGYRPIVTVDGFARDL